VNGHAVRTFGASARAFALSNGLVGNNSPYKKYFQINATRLHYHDFYDCTFRRTVDYAAKWLIVMIPYFELRSCQGDILYCLKKIRSDISLPNFYLFATEHYTVQLKTILLTRCAKGMLWLLLVCPLCNLIFPSIHGSPYRY
jgi:hypothetical protein